MVDEVQQKSNLLGPDPVVAIDGPSGSGKSSVARALARELDYLYVDTGAMYRALAVYFHDQDLKFEALSSKVRKKVLELLPFRYGKSEQVLIEIDGENLSERIREPWVSPLASELSQIPEIREYLVSLQRELGAKRPCVMEGRDIASVVFPKAMIKIFLTAKNEVRASRRAREELAQSAPHASEEEIKLRSKEVLLQIEKRDQADAERKLAPLKLVADARVIDTSEMSFEEVVKELCQLVRAREREEFVSPHWETHLEKKKIGPRRESSSAGPML